MIPDFKTYLKESVWMDIHKRSTGEAERKEEDINLLDMNGFYKYLCDRYEKANDYMSTKYIEKLENGKSISIMMFEDTNHSRVYRVVIWNFDKIPYITIGRNPETTNSNYFKKISGKYKMIKSGDERFNPLYTIEPKDGSEGGSNRFFLEVIDFLLDNIEPPFEPYIRRKVNESVWMDIHKHSTGDVERKEDRLVGAVKNLVPMDLGGKCLWADRDLEIDGQTSFTYDDASQFIGGVNGWRLPTFTDIINLDTRIMHNDYSFQDDELHITNRKTNGELVFSNQGPYPGLRGFYYFWHVDGGIRYGRASYFIKDNNKCVVGSFGSSDPRYTFCIRLVKDKEVSESVWMDIHKHSTGDAERKEESIDLLDGNDFYEYLKDLYISENPDKDIIGGPFMDDIMTMPFLDEENMLEYNLEIVYKPGRHEIQFVTIPDHSTVNYDDLEDTFELGLADDERRVGLYPKDGSGLTNTFVITVIDYLLDHSKKYAPKFTKKIDESVWMDIHKRSNNEIDRKEDYVDFDDLEPEELCDYIKNHYILPDNIGVLGYDDDNAELYVHILQYEKKQSKFKQVTFDTLQYDYEYDVIKIHKDTYPQLLEKLREKFNVMNCDQFDLKIVPDDLGEPSNKFFMEILDYIVEILPEIPGITPLIKSKKQVLESVWMDIHKHSTGDVERMEDAVDTNGLFPGEMVQYLKNRYEYTIQNPKYSEQITHAGGSDFYDIDVPLYPSCSIRISYEMKKDVIKKMKLQLYFSKNVSKEEEQRNANVLYQLENKYIVEYLHTYDYIRPRKGKVTNDFAVELIDFILSVTENKPYILKRI